MSCNTLWGYLDVCRGRYLCTEHGSFCDSSDDYQSSCPRCPDTGSGADVKGSAEVRNNPLDRGLQIMRNLQSRSARYASIIGGVFASMAALAVIFHEAKDLSALAMSNSWFVIVCAVVFLFSLISLCFFLASMAHMPTLAGRPARFMTKTIADWECHVAFHLSRFECRHSWGVRFLVSAIFSFVIFGPLTLICVYQSSP